MSTKKEIRKVLDKIYVEDTVQGAYKTLFARFFSARKSSEFLELKNREIKVKFYKLHTIIAQTIESLGNLVFVYNKLS